MKQANPAFIPRNHRVEQVIELLTLAERLQKKPEPQALAGKILGLLFFNPSLRTLASFQAAMARLGGNSFVISAGQGTWQLETDVEKASRVSVAFTADGDRTRVVVVHKDFWRMAEGGQGMADAVGSVDGWGSGLKHFADFAAK